MSRLDQDVDPRVRRTKKLLHDAMKELIHEKDFQKITVQEIAAKATVNRATFYAHYLSKEELAADLALGFLNRCLSSRLEPDAPFNESNLAKFFAGVFDLMAAMKGVCPHDLSELEASFTSTVQRGIVEALDAWLTQSSRFQRYYPAVPKSTILAVLSYAAFGRAKEWADSGQKQSIEDASKELVMILVPNPVF
jgi:AcrR family transcriptional regulator